MNNVPMTLNGVDLSEVSLQEYILQTFDNQLEAKNKRLPMLDKMENGKITEELLLMFLFLSALGEDMFVSYFLDTKKIFKEDDLKKTITYLKKNINPDMAPVLTDKGIFINITLMQCVSRELFLRSEEEINKIKKETKFNELETKFNEITGDSIHILQNEKNKNRIDIVLYKIGYLTERALVGVLFSIFKDKLDLYSEDITENILSKDNWTENFSSFFDFFQIKEKMKKFVFKKCESATKFLVNSIDNKISHLSESIAIKNSELKRLLQLKSNEQRNKFSVQFNDPIRNEFMTHVLRSPCTQVRVFRDEIFIKVKVFLDDFEEKLLQRYFESNNGNMFDVLPEEKKQLIKDIFIEKKYKLLTYHCFKINFQRCILEDNRLFYEFFDNREGIRNPHLFHAHCWGDHITMINSSLASQNFIAALDCAAFAVQNLNFADMQILGCFLDDLFSPGFKHTPMLYNKETGKMISVSQYFETEKEKKEISIKDAKKIFLKHFFLKFKFLLCILKENNVLSSDEYIKDRVEILLNFFSVKDVDEFLCIDKTLEDVFCSMPSVVEVIKLDEAASYCQNKVYFADFQEVSFFFQNLIRIYANLFLYNPATKEEIIFCNLNHVLFALLYREFDSKITTSVHIRGDFCFRYTQPVAPTKDNELLKIIKNLLNENLDENFEEKYNEFVSIILSKYAIPYPYIISEDIPMLYHEIEQTQNKDTADYNILYKQQETLSCVEQYGEDFMSDEDLENLNQNTYNVDKYFSILYDISKELETNTKNDDKFAKIHEKLLGTRDEDDYDQEDTDGWEDDPEDEQY